MLVKIISGGQTGVDRGALDAALELSFPCGGWCPKGRRAEDGIIPERYPLDELATRAYRARTRRNVLDSDGTLIIYFGELAGGTLETLRLTQQLEKPALAINAAETSMDEAVHTALQFINCNSIAIFNVAGPRHSSWSGGARYAKKVVGEIIRRWSSS